MADDPPPPPTHTMFFAPPHPPLDTRGVQKSRVITKHTSSDFVDKYYDFVKFLGEGGFGQVTLVEEKQFKQKRVCKRVPLNRNLGRDTLELMKREVALLRRLDHPHVIKIYEYALDDANKLLVLILEHLCGGDVFDYLVASPNCMLGEPAAVNIVRQVLFGLRYCHAKGIVHRDIKLENFVLTSSLADSGSEPVCKIIDFGFATNPDSEVRGSYGTPAYMAPEVAMFVTQSKAAKVEDYTSKVDLWSAGVCALLMLCGYNPFDVNGDHMRSCEKILKYKDFENLKLDMRATSPLPELSSEAWHFLSSLIEKTPDVRLAADGALEHAWLQLHAGGGHNADMAAIALNLGAYQCAPPVARCCLYLIAARLDVPELQRFGGTFLELDTNGDGTLSREELAVAIKNAEECADTDVDINVIMEAADLSHKGGINFTEFIAACLYQSYASIGSLGELMQRAFLALDSDRDGFVSLEDVLPLFRERDAKMFQWLPQDRPFDVVEWLSCLKKAGENPDTTSKLLANEVPVTPPQLSQPSETITVSPGLGGAYSNLQVIEESENDASSPKLAEAFVSTLAADEGKAEGAPEKKAAQEEEVRKKAEEDAEKKAAEEEEEEEVRKKAEKAAEKKAAEEEEAQKKVEEAAEKKAAEQEEARKKAEGAAEKKDAEEEEARKKAAEEEEEARKKAEEAVKKKAAEEEEEARKKAEEAARKKAAEEEEARKKAEETVKKANEEKEDAGRKTQEVAEAAPEAGKALGDTQPLKFTYAVLSAPGHPAGVDPACKEDHLTDEEFLTVFGMSMADFKKLAKWKQQKAKKEKNLF